MMELERKSYFHIHEEKAQPSWSSGFPAIPPNPFHFWTLTILMCVNMIMSSTVKVYYILSVFSIILLWKIVIELYIPPQTIFSGTVLKRSDLEN